MKQILLIVLMLCSTVVLAKEITVKVSGMVCSLCAQGIQKKFKEVKAVKEIKVDLTNKVVLVTTIDDQDIPDAKITDIITKAGYNIGSIQRK